jgi:hypothetical protein
MSANVSVDQTPTGWRVVVKEADEVVIETDGPGIVVAIHPDDDDTSSKPLDVTLAT